MCNYFLQKQQTKEMSQKPAVKPAALSREPTQISKKPAVDDEKPSQSATPGLEIGDKSDSFPREPLTEIQSPNEATPGKLATFKNILFKMAFLKFVSVSNKSSLWI